MEFSETHVPGVLVIDINPIEDERGFFSRIFCHDEFAEQGLDLWFSQANTALSDRPFTLRGMHHQLEPDAEHKLVRCTRGSVFDVAVDLRADSPTYRLWVGEELTEDNHRSLFVPPGVAHGYLTLEPRSEVVYWTSSPFAPGSATGVRFDDPGLAIEWPHQPAVVSERDLAWPLIDIRGDES